MWRVSSLLLLPCGGDSDLMSGCSGKGVGPTYTQTKKKRSHSEPHQLKADPITHSLRHPSAFISGRWERTAAQKRVR